MIQQLREISTSIAASVDEQSAATNEIARSVQQAATGIDTMSGIITGVADAAAGTDEACDSLLSSSDELSRNADVVGGRVADFMKEIRG